MTNLRSQSPSSLRIALSAVEMGKLLGVSHRTLLKSTVPRTRVGRRILFLPATVEAYLAANPERAIVPASN